MELPLETQQLCEKALEKVRQDSQHQLSFVEKDAIYESFESACFNFPEHIKKGNSPDFEEYHQYLENNFKNMNQGDYVISWLGILAVKHVLLGWKFLADLDYWEKKYLENIENMLQDSQDLLTGKLDFQEAHERLLERYWYFSHNFVKADLGFLNASAIYMFSVVIYGGARYEVANYAETAYSVIDHNPPGVAERLESAIPFEYNLIRRLVFWEWWLTEAIPQAWELANKTYSP